MIAKQNQESIQQITIKKISGKSLDNPCGKTQKILELDNMFNWLESQILSQISVTRTNYISLIDSVFIENY